MKIYKGVQRIYFWEETEWWANATPARRVRKIFIFEPVDAFLDIFFPFPLVVTSLDLLFSDV